MNNQEISDFLSCVDGLFPKNKLNAEQSAMWASRVRALTFTESMSALNDYFAAPRKPAHAPHPSLAGFLDKYRGGKPAKAGVSESGDWREAIKGQWVRRYRERGDESTANEIQGLTLEAIEMAYVQGLFHDGLEAYGADSLMTLKRFNDWQDCAARQGHERMEFDRDHWHAERMRKLEKGEAVRQ